ncbi:ATP-dependent DNA helicase [Rossellomorea vietnamensis]|uniref:ATP-dependent DNA helicase n=1 Tax=Rossellomorea vietnamensis TaxID=218284 RepID=A0A6I6UTI4_9BACI|nr:ATP-dependent DNA helicase [Rossellomorea vietnamensis]QHE61950.1 ATP-dependent DNA helicase [Rossellomorea vietnamensis]
MRRKLPFELTKEQSFYEALSDWVGDVFYDILPEKGFDLRDEQVFMAFQLNQAYKNKQVMFAEAGVGTGKTLVYLLYALSYARYTGKPAIIACADETLIEQIVKKEGDIEKLENALDLDIDVRLAKSREQYLCIKKLEENASQKDVYQDMWEELPGFVHDNSSMRSFTHYGDRKEYAGLSDEEWNSVGWDSLQDCMSCAYRHRCGLTLHREHYRNASDLIICSHDFYMEHIWTKDSRKREGQLPLLPEASSVVFDEGHLLEFASQKAMTYRMRMETLEGLLEKLSSSDMREETLYIIEDIMLDNEKWFELLEKESKGESGSDRQYITRSEAILQQAGSLTEKIENLLNELVFESEMYVMDDYLLKVVEEYLEQIQYSLKLFLDDEKGIYWLETSEEEHTFVVMPRLVEEILKEQVFSQNIPFIFSSATLSYNRDFSYVSRSLGIETYEKFSVESPYEYEEMMRAHIPSLDSGVDSKNQYVWEKLQSNQGKSLILFTSKDEMNAFRAYQIQQADQNWSVIYEGDREISDTVEQFQQETSTVLCSYHLWEGLDVPGDSLSQVIIYSLPFPPKDPVFDAKRKHATHSVEEVDLPYMMLRLRQGIGRLIRTSDDKGSVHVLLNDDETPYRELAESVLPVGIEVLNV